MHFTFNLALPGTRLSGSALAAVDTTRGGGQCLALWQVSGRGGGGVMTMLMFLGLKSKERARWANQGGGWFVGTEDPS